MIQTVEQIELIHSKKITVISCDFCKKQTTSKEFPEFDGITSFEIRPGFGSVYDFEEFNLDICDHCLKTRIIPLTQQGVSPAMLDDDEVGFLLSTD